MQQVLQMTQDAQNPIPTIEVGQTAGDGLTLWCAKEALRQGELRIASQQTAYANFMARANACIGWSVTLTAAFCAGSTQPNMHWFIFPALFTTGAAFLSAAVFCSRKMGVPGDIPDYIMNTEYQTELEVTQTLAMRCQRDINFNNSVIKELKEYMDMAFILLAISTLTAAILAAAHHFLFT